MYDAAEAGDEEAVQQMLARGTAADGSTSTPSITWLLPLEEAVPFDWMFGLPIHRAASKGHAGVVQLLLEAAATTAFAVNISFKTPLHRAAVGGHTATVQLLVTAAPATASAVNRDGQTPLHLAAMGGHVAVVRVLAEAAPATLTAFDVNGRAALSLAAQEGHAAVVQAFVEVFPAMAATPNNRGFTPLHYAAYKKQAAVVQLLAAVAPATVSAVDNIGRTPLDCALQGALGPLEAARCLVQAAPTVQPSLDSLIRARQLADTLYGDLVSHLALTRQEWQSIPAPCPDLVRVLPVVLARSETEAGWLVGRLEPEQRARLRTAVLCMGRTLAGVEGAPSLPVELSQLILALALGSPMFPTSPATMPGTGQPPPALPATVPAISPPSLATPATASAIKTPPALARMFRCCFSPDAAA